MEESTSNVTSQAGPATDRGVAFAIVAALELEAAPLRDRLADPTTFRPGGLAVSVGRLGETTVAIVAGGVGEHAASRATRLVIDGHRPSRVLAVGLCGGLSPSLQRSSLFVPDAVIAANGTDRLPLEIPAWLRDQSLITGGTLVTSDRVVCSPSDKSMLRDRIGAAAVDMESLGVAREAAVRGIPAIAVRVVCDAVDDAIPEDIAKLLAFGSGARQAGAAVRLAWRRPSALMELAELRERAHLAADRLASVLGQLVTTLPPT